MIFLRFPGFRLARSIGTLSFPQLKPQVVDKKPAVVILGFYGSHPNQLAGYIDLYNNLGYKTLTYNLPKPMVFEYDQARHEDITATLINQLEPEEDICVHSLSNNGFTLYQHFVKHPASSSRIAGAIFDSCPGPWHILSNLGGEQGWRALEGDQSMYFALLGYMLLHKMEGKSMADCLKGAKQVYEKLKPNWEIHSETHKSPGHHMITEKETFPILFLYSKKDRLIPYTFIEKLLELQASSGRRVIAHDFHESSHVAHLKSFPDKYREVVREFMRECKQ